MIGSLTGTVSGTRGASLIVSVQGVGYLIAVRSPYSFTPGESVTLHTHLAVRENALDLYGFAAPEELAMFQSLIELPKIGPKTAMQILMQAEVTTLRHAVQTQDPIYLSKMSGIGKKTAEKIVTGLKDVLGDAAWDTSESTPDHDVLDALLALGYSQKDARDALELIDPTITDTRKRITEALRHITKAH